jgi:hypothetical protein
MENRKSKTKERKFYKESEYNGRSQFTFLIKFEGDDKQYVYNSSVKEPKYFKEGEEQEYTYEHKTGTKKDGTSWEMHVVKPVYPKPNFGGKGGFQQMTIEDYIQRQKVDSVGYAMSYAEKLAEAKAIEINNLSEYAKIVLNWMLAEIDEVAKTFKENE